MSVRICFRASTPNCANLEQLYPVPLSIENVVAQVLPVHVTASGRVDAVQSDIHCFIMMVSQPLNGVSDAQAKIRGVMGLNMNQSLLLPSRGTVLSLSGLLLACEEMVIQVAIERIALLPVPMVRMCNTD